MRLEAVQGYKGKAECGNVPDQELSAAAAAAAAALEMEQRIAMARVL